MQNVYFSKTKPVKTPTRANLRDAGIDFFIPDDFNDRKPLTLKHGDDVVIPSGIYMRQVDLDMMKFENKSGIAVKKGLIIGACIIDNEYQGELHINLIKATSSECTIEAGDKIAQGIFYEPKYRDLKEHNIEDLYDAKSDRGDGKFGSSGDK